jgi:chaperonin GroEL
MDYAPKKLTFGEDGRERLTEGIRKLSEAVKSTLGPSGNTVLIESDQHIGGMVVTKDGVSVARSIDLLDPIENLAVRIMKQAADRTATNAGDGTTTAIVLTEAIIMSVLQQVEESSEPVSMIEVIREMNRIGDEVIDSLDNMAIPVTEESLAKVATISANNDDTIGSLIADTYINVGMGDGIVTLARSKTPATWSEVIDGIRIDKGFAHPLFINDQRRDECVLEDVHVLMSDTEINNFHDIEGVLKHVVQKGLRLLIIAPCSKNLLDTLAGNVVKRGLKLCVVEPPSFGYRQTELMGDIAVSTGATFFSEKMGDDLSLIEEKDLGKVSRIIVSRDSAVLMREDGDHDAVKERVDQLWVQHEEAEQKGDRDFIKERIASLLGGIGVIHVGGNTDMEHKELYDRVDDAVCAVRSALSDGVVAGGGVALARIAKNTGLGSIARDAMAEAMYTPLHQIMRNAGMPKKAYHVMNMEGNDGVNAKTGETGDMVDMGVIDPAKVTKEAIKNAISVAGTLLSTNAIVTMARFLEKD